MRAGARLLIGVAVASVVAVGCSQGVQSSDTAPSTTPPAASTSTPAAADVPSAVTTATPPTTATTPTSTTSTTEVSASDTEFAEDARLILDLYAGWSRAVSVGDREIEAYLAAHLYPDLPQCAPGEKTLPAYTALGETIQRADEWTITWGPLDGVRPSGRVYEVQLAELESPSHVAILHSVAYVFWNCAGVSPTGATYEASVTVESGTMHAYSAWHDPDAGGFFGSGCSPGTENLPDGVWYGRITDVAAEVLSFDLYCKGPPPADGEEWWFTIVNKNTKIRRVAIGSSAQVFSIAPDGGHLIQPYSVWYLAPHPTMFCPADGCWDVVLFINQGRVTEIIQTWNP